ncbi:Na(+)/glucose symporter [Limihaloglobus sulfuriphilus]|uniref:Na(+)/glucose symporter n=1 Tax=Limihaloglobus sulfuriphilus TaxID=1851148 RepID=A0A1Q2MGR7_9BACT|nr:sodium:solute symporter family protein [Limihaloglobus sulfuriphilus]AQQ71844.1 Na(+)/glucose symporter [Limihaloglobus sulfuriphilus]
MQLQMIDWVSIFGFFLLSLIVGVLVSRKAGKSASSFFLSGRNMPWWLLGVSMVATTFSTDTPNLVTDIVRQNGVSGNWAWWAFLLTGMLTVFVYAKLWRRSGVMTDVEFYELRYSGRTAAFLRGFRAIYLGIFFNVVIMATVTLAAIKIGAVMLNLSPFETVTIAAVVTVSYSMLGGLTGVLITDFFQFGIAMFGAVMAAKHALGHQAVGSLSNLITNPEITDKLSILPDFSDTGLLVSVFIIPLAVQWWSVWYPGAEPGGGGYLVQRMLSAKNEKHAVWATLFFNIAHYALRPWPWIIVALSSLLVFPDLQSLRDAFPNVNPSVVRNDMAYPAMLTFLPAGLLGLVLASLIAAYMSTISTHLNLGSSYIVNDFYRRFINPNATEKQLVRMGRICTLLLMIAACALAPLLENAKQAFDLLLQIGAGTGLLFILRWFWWRINALSEITAMAVSFLIACYFTFIHSHTPLPQLESWQRLVTGVALTTASWLIVTFLTRPSEKETLRSFYRLVKPGGPGWRAVVENARAENQPVDTDDKGWDLPVGILCMFFGCTTTYGALFATGYWIYGNYTPAVILTLVSAAAAVLLINAWKRLRINA